MSMMERASVLMKMDDLPSDLTVNVHDAMPRVILHETASSKVKHDDGKTTTMRQTR